MTELVWPDKWLAAMKREVSDFEDRKVFFFDMDGTLTGTLSGNICANTPEDVFLLPNTNGYIQTLHRHGKKLVLWTNQGGVAHGIMPEMMAWWIVRRVYEMFHEAFDLVKVNCYHDKGRFKHFYPDKAKPNPRMIQEAIEEMGVQYEDCIAVGNAFSDSLSAEKAGVPFIWAHTFFGWPESLMVKDHHGYSIAPEHLDKLRAEAIRSE